MALTSFFPMMGQCSASLDVCYSSPFPGKFGQASAVLAMMLSSESMTSTNAMISNISVAPSSSWYFSLSPFESIMLGMIVLKVNQAMKPFYLAKIKPNT